MRPFNYIIFIIVFFAMIFILTYFEPNIEELQLRTVWTVVLGISAGFGGSLGFYVIFLSNRPKLIVKDNVNIERFNIFKWRYTVEVENKSWAELIDNESLLYVYITDDKIRDSKRTFKLAGHLRTPIISKYNKHDHDEKHIHRFEFISKRKLGVMQCDNYLRFTLFCRHGRSDISGVFTKDISNYTVCIKGSRFVGDSLNMQDKLDDQLEIKLQ